MHQHVLLRSNSEITIRHQSRSGPTQETTRRAYARPIRHDHVTRSFSDVIDFLFKNFGAQQVGLISQRMSIPVKVGDSDHPGPLCPQEAEDEPGFPRRVLGSDAEAGSRKRNHRNVLHLNQNIASVDQPLHHYDDTEITLIYAT